MGHLQSKTAQITCMGLALERDLMGTQAAPGEVLYILPSKDGNC